MSAQPNLPPEEEEESRTRAHAGGAEMTLIEHLKELRNRVIKSALAVVVGVVLCAVFWETILGWLLAPARESHPEFELAVFGPTESIGVLFKIAMYGGLLAASPVVIYQILMFVIPGLTPRERRAILPGMFGAVAFLLAGMAFAYWVVLPVSLEFLLDFGGDNFEPFIGAKQYLDFATRIVFWVGISFELPMVIALLARLGLVRARQLIHFWRYAILIVFIIAAVITPTPDPLTQSLVAGPLILLYVLGILFAWMLQRPASRSSAA
jgi:sec-independent protein translocase protein TatC